MFMMRPQPLAGRSPPSGPHADDLHAVTGSECGYWDYYSVALACFSAWNNNAERNSIKSHSSWLESSTY